MEKLCLLLDTLIEIWIIPYEIFPNIYNDYKPIVAAECFKAFKEKQLVFKAWYSVKSIRSEKDCVHLASGVINHKTKK